MNQIINGKKYDTETARRIGRISNPRSGVFEELYIKKNGEFFMFSIGYSHALEEHSNERLDYDDVTLKTVIFPLSEGAAKEWVSKAMDADTYEELFGEVEE